MTKFFCDYCNCSMCKTGDDGLGRESITRHAPTTDGKWICDICYEYSACIHAQRLANAEHRSPCPNLDCKHRPELSGNFIPIREEWTKLEELADKHVKDIYQISSPTQKKSFPEYRQIVDFGWTAVPFILERMRNGEFGDWDLVLNEITGIDPVPREDWGKVEAIRLAWINHFDKDKWQKIEV